MRGTVVLRSYRPQRVQGAALGASCGTISVLIGGFVLWTWQLRSYGLSPPLAAALIATIPVVTGVLAIAGMFAVFRWSDAELSTTAVRLPFERHFLRRGWRAFDEIRVVAIWPDPATVRAATELASRMSWSCFMRAIVERWRAHGGLIVITRDEILWLEGEAPYYGELVARWISFQHGRQSGSG